MDAEELPRGVTDAQFGVESGGEIVLLDPVAPTQEGSKLWTRLDTRLTTLIMVLKPDHVRDVDFFVCRYGVRAFGSEFFNHDDVPETELEPVLPGSTLPGGLVALYDGRGRNDTPIWLPEHRTIVFADALTAPEGERFPRYVCDSSFRLRW